jgi:multidrug transporter EmrE-like cation transporter
MNVALLSPLAGLIGAAAEIGPAYRRWRRGEEDVLGVMRSTGHGALIFSLSIAAMVTTPTAVACAILLGSGTVADALPGPVVLARRLRRRRLSPSGEATSAPPRGGDPAGADRGQ